VTAGLLPIFVLLLVGPVQDDGAVVRSLLEERSAAVEGRDLSRVARLYVNDDRLVVFRPDAIYRGWSDYRAYWERALPGVPDGFRIRWHDDMVVHASGGSIVASLTWSTSGGGTAKQEGRVTLVLERHGDRYLIVHEHLSGMPTAGAGR
jgi:ketosteroid isomerase-like protein